MMAAAGVNIVRMAEFAWDRIEPQPGNFEFSIFDETIDALGTVGIDTILCTLRCRDILERGTGPR
ncbi:beta-galactosidase [Terrimicrobium sacchariphilum]|uniref:Beta-galactosidase n=2 Tax=Terrimicrobium sacchariphilum TaxID=690879 RepID=A0A146GCF5_TERSA|nr:beta-galactosidase [Terrimicrobium sacchariphilum]